VSSKRSAHSGRASANHTLIVIIWHVLANDCDYQDPGGDYFDKRNSAAARQHYLVRELEKLGHTVTLQPAA